MSGTVPCLAGVWRSLRFEHSGRAARVLAIALCWQWGLPANAVAQSAGQPPELSSYNPHAVVRARTSSDAERLRSELIRFIWKAESLPRAFPTNVQDVTTVPSFDPGPVAPYHAQRLSQIMEFGITTHAYFLQARDQRNCLFIYHTGHDGPPSIAVRESLLKRILYAGCDIVLAAMPLMHENPKPVVSTRFGPVALRHHNSLGLLADDAFNPLKLFLHPVLAAINHAVETRGPYAHMYMGGLSGGGWTTTVYAALDPRITVSFPIAGSLPLALASFAQEEIGDWEQLAAGLHKYADYLDLYLLATYPERLQVQMLNVNDSCCFAGRFAAYYDKAVEQIATAWNGRFEVVLDVRSHGHAVQRPHVDAMLAAMRRISGLQLAPAPPSECVQWSASAVSLTGPFSRLGGHAYIALAPTLAAVSDTNELPKRSPVILCEDDEPLGPSHSLHDHVQHVGRGAYSHFGAGIIFSAFDNSDPNQNFRRYSIVFPPAARQ